MLHTEDKRVASFRVCSPFFIWLGIFAHGENVCEYPYIYQSFAKHGDRSTFRIVLKIFNK